MFHPRQQMKFLLPQLRRIDLLLTSAVQAEKFAWLEGQPSGAPGSVGNTLSQAEVDQCTHTLRTCKIYFRAGTVF